MNRNKNTLYLVQLSIFVAIVLLLAYTPLGYIHIFALEITPIMIPVTMGAILLGPGAGAVLGGVFGLTSFGTCFGSSPFGAMLLSINPISTFITCVIARILAGWLTGVVFQQMYRYPSARKFSFAAAGLMGNVWNTIFFMGSIVLFFWNSSYIQELAAGMGTANPVIFILLFVGIQSVFSTIVNLIVAGGVSKVLYPVLHR